MAMEKSTLRIGNQIFSYYVFRQHDLNNCGPSSIAMLIKYSLNRDVAIGFIQMACGKAEVVQRGFNAQQADARWHGWGEGAWTTGWTLLHTLKTKWPALNAFEDENARNAKIRASSAGKPALCRVAWNGTNAGHFVVCVGKSGNNLVFLDPYFGIVVTADADLGGFIQYSTANNSFGKGAQVGKITYAIFTNA